MFASIESASQGSRCLAALVKRRHPRRRDPATLEGANPNDHSSSRSAALPVRGPRWRADPDVGLPPAARGLAGCALINDEPITGYEIQQRVALSMLGAPEVQKKLQARLKSANMNEQFKNFAMKRLQANPPKSEAEQQARVKQLQGEFVSSIKSQIEKEYVPTARKQALDEIIDDDRNRIHTTQSLVEALLRDRWRGSACRAGCSRLLSRKREGEWDCEQQGKQTCGGFHCGTWLCDYLSRRLQVRCRANFPSARD